MRRIAWLGLFTISAVAACYGPQLGSPGYFCHPDDNPACPEGQTCAAAGGGSFRCVTRGVNNQQDGGLILPDLSMSGTHHDLSMGGGAHDFAMSNGMTGCLGEINCINGCAANDQTCVQTCESNTTSQGNQLFMNLINCLLSACPDVQPTDPCYDNTSTACTQCFNDAQMPTGACGNETAACDNDGP